MSDKVMQPKPTLNVVRAQIHAMNRARKLLGGGGGSSPKPSTAEKEENSKFNERESA